MNTIDLILERLDAEAILNSYGIQWKPAKGGTELSFRCPFHDDKNPSISMNRDTTLYNCFVCGAGGNGIHFIAQMDGTDFATALKKAAGITGVRLSMNDEQREALDLEERRILAIEKLVRLAEAALWSSQGGVALRYLRDRGLDDEIIKKFRLGYLNIEKLVPFIVKKSPNLPRSDDQPTQVGIPTSPGWDSNLPPKTDENYTTSLLELISIEDLRFAGILRYSDDNNVKNIPAQASIMFPVFSRGKPVSMVFRNTNQRSEKRWVFPFAVYGHGVDWLYNEHSLHNAKREIAFCEGAMDAITLEQWGIPAVGVLGLSSAAKFAPKFINQKRVYLLLDNDQAGQNKLIQTAKAIQKELRHGEVYLPALPNGIKDPNEWMQKDGTADKAAEMLSNAPTLINLLTAKSKDIKDPRDRIEAMREIVEIIADLRDPFLESLYSEEVKKAFKGVATKATLNSAIAKCKTEKTHSYEEGFAYTEERPLHPALDFQVNSPAVAQCLVAERDELGGSWSIMRVSKDDGEMKVERIVPEPDGALAKRMPAPLNPEEDLPWNTDPVETYSATTFLKGDTPDVATGEMYARILDTWKKFVWLKHPEDYHILTAFVMGSYVHRIWMYFPYIWLHGNKASGKSTILEILQAISWQGQRASNISPAALFRLVDALRPTLLIDEAEQLGNSSNPAMIELGCLLNDGYKKGGKVLRVGGDRESMKTESFEAFGPKVIASVKHIGTVLASRTIRLDMVSPGRKKLYEIKSRKLEFSRAFRNSFLDLRNRLHCWKFQHFDELKDIFDNTLESMAKIEQMDGRELELWAPLFSIGILADNDLDLDAQSSLHAAWKRRNDSRGIEDLTNQEKIIWAVWSAIKSDSVSKTLDEYLLKKELVSAVNEIVTDSFDWERDVKMNAVTVALKSVDAIEDEKRARHMAGPKERMLKINNEALKDFLETRVNLEAFEEAKKGKKND